MDDENTNIFPSLWANIPASVLFDKDLTPSAKLIYGVISALSISKGYCFATNNTIGKLFKLQPKTVSEIIGQLAKKRYIYVELIQAKNGKADSRRIWIDGCRFGTEYPPEKTGGSPPKKPEGASRKNGKTPPKKPEEINNIYNKKLYIAPQEVIDQLKAYAGNDDELLSALMGFAEMRAKTKATISTKQTLTLLTNKLDKLSGSSNRIKIAMLEESTLKNWKTVYPPKNGRAPTRPIEEDGDREW